MTSSRVEDAETVLVWPRAHSRETRVTPLVRDSLSGTPTEATAPSVASKGMRSPSRALPIRVCESMSVSRLTPGGAPALSELAESLATVAIAALGGPTAAGAAALREGVRYAKKLVAANAPALRLRTDVTVGLTP